MLAPVFGIGQRSMVQSYLQEPYDQFRCLTHRIEQNFHRVTESSDTAKGEVSEESEWGLGCHSIGLAKKGQGLGLDRMFIPGN